MSNGTEQQITKQDLQSLIEESNRHKKWGNVYKIAQIVVTPLIITIVSMFVTWRINIQQSNNTEEITRKQIESAQIIARANRENSAKISESAQRIARLTHIKDIFKNLLTDAGPNSPNQDIETQRMQIISLEVYKEDALLFLLNIKDHYQVSQEKAPDGSEKKGYGTLIAQADDSISKILLNSQVDVSGRFFMDCTGPADSCKSFKKNFRELRAELFNSITGKQAAMKGENPFMAQYKSLRFNEISMRKQQYKNYNFSDCFFVSVNLYSADFSSCTLTNNLFVKVDLQEASFSGSNLSGSIFRESNLQKVDFRDSRLRNVVFVNPILNKRDADNTIKTFCRKNSCSELEGAYFSLGSLLWTSTPPFNIFDRERNKDISKELRQERLLLYINLLMRHRRPIALMAEAAEKGGTKEKAKLGNLLKNTATEDWPELDQRLKEAENKTKILATPASAPKYTLFSKH